MVSGYFNIKFFAIMFISGHSLFISSSTNFLRLAIGILGLCFWWYCLEYSSLSNTGSNFRKLIKFSSPSGIISPFGKVAYSSAIFSLFSTKFFCLLLNVTLFVIGLLVALFVFNSLFGVFPPVAPHPACLPDSVFVSLGLCLLIAEFTVFVNSGSNR